MFTVVFTTLSPFSCKKPVMVFFTLSASSDSSGRVTPCSAPKALRFSHHAWIWAT